MAVQSPRDLHSQHDAGVYHGVGVLLTVLMDVLQIDRRRRRRPARQRM